MVPDKSRVVVEMAFHQKSEVRKWIPLKRLRNRNLRKGVGENHRGTEVGRERHRMRSKSQVTSSDHVLLI